MGDISTAPVAPLYVCVHVPEFPAQARLRLRPDQRRLPVAVLGGDPPLDRVCSANHTALALGVRHGMTRTELDSFSGLVTLRRSDAEERAARSALLHLASTFTPRMQVCSGTYAGCAPFAFVLDMTGTARIFGPPRQAAKSIECAVRSLGLRANLAMSSNYNAAVCASPFADQGPMVMAAGRQRDALKRLPLTALRPTAEQQSMFDLWGLRTLGDLAELPEVELIVRLGQEGKRLRQLAWGEHPHLMVPEEPVFTLEEHLAFDSPLEMLDSLLFVLGPMIDQLTVRAQTHALALASLTAMFTLDGGGEHSRTLKPALPLTDREVLLKLLHLDLQAHPPPAGVLSVHLHAEPGRRGDVQAGLFSPPLPEPMRLDVTLARIAALVGEDRVGRARLLDTHRPDSFAMERFTVPADAPRVLPVRPAAALRRLRPPILLTMRLRAATPRLFFFHGKCCTVTEAYGPWRRSGEWWSDAVWSREYWDVCATTGEGECLLCVLAQDLLQKSWYIEALYD